MTFVPGMALADTFGRGNRHEQFGRRVRLGQFARCRLLGVKSTPIPDRQNLRRRSNVPLPRNIPERSRHRDRSSTRVLDSPARSRRELRKAFGAAGFRRNRMTERLIRLRGQSLRPNTRAPTSASSPIDLPETVPSTPAVQPSPLTNPLLAAPADPQDSDADGPAAPAAAIAVLELASVSRRSRPGRGLRSHRQRSRRYRLSRRCPTTPRKFTAKYRTAPLEQRSARQQLRPPRPPTSTVMLRSPSVRARSASLSTPGGTRVYVTNISENTVSVIDAVAVIATIPVGSFAYDVPVVSPSRRTSADPAL